MSNRERWVVYPLLVWALAMGFRSQYEYLFERDPLQCQELRIVDESGKTRLRLRAASDLGGLVQFFDETGAAKSVLGEAGTIEPPK